MWVLYKTKKSRKIEISVDQKITATQARAQEGGGREELGIKTPAMDEKKGEFP